MEVKAVLVEQKGKGLTNRYQPVRFHRHSTEAGDTLRFIRRRPKQDRHPPDNLNIRTGWLASRRNNLEQMRQSLATRAWQMAWL